MARPARLHPFLAIALLLAACQHSPGVTFGEASFRVEPGGYRGTAFLAATDMEPCADRADCPLYEPPARYRTALEVPQGRLRSLGVGAGARLTVGGAC